MEGLWKRIITPRLGVLPERMIRTATYHMFRLCPSWCWGVAFSQYQYRYLPRGVPRNSAMERLTISEIAFPAWPQRQRHHHRLANSSVPLRYLSARTAVEYAKGDANCDWIDPRREHLQACGLSAAATLWADSWLILVRCMEHQAIAIPFRCRRPWC